MDFSPDAAIKLSWESKERCPGQTRKKQYRPRATSSTSCASESQKNSETCSATSDEEEQEGTQDLY